MTWLLYALVILIGFAFVGLVVAAVIASRPFGDEGAYGAVEGDRSFGGRG